VTKQELQFRISELEDKLKETKESAAWTKGPVNDAMKLVIPMMHDQLQLMRDVVNAMA
jgi:hypothetical protein